MISLDFFPYPKAELQVNKEKTHLISMLQSRTWILFLGGKNPSSPRHIFIWTIPSIKQLLCVLVYRSLMYSVLSDEEHTVKKASRNSDVSNGGANQTMWGSENSYSHVVWFWATVVNIGIWRIPTWLFLQCMGQQVLQTGLPSSACGLQLPVSKLTELRTSQRMV